MRKIKGYEDWTAPLISRSVRSTLSLDSKAVESESSFLSEHQNKADELFENRNFVL